MHSVGKALAQNTNIELCLAAGKDQGDLIFSDSMYCLSFFASLLGGLETKGQEAALRKNPDIIIATPGRLVDHLHNTPSFSLQTIEILVLDEADRYSPLTVVSDCEYLGLEAFGFIHSYTQMFCLLKGNIGSIKVYFSQY